LDSVLNQLTVTELKQLIIKLIPRCSVNVKDVIREVLLARDKGKVQSTASEEPQQEDYITKQLPLGGVSPQRALMTEIENAVRGGKLVLKRVDTAAETENTKKLRAKTQFQQLMEEIKSRSSDGRRVVLLDQGTLPPREFWKVSLGKWYEEVEKGFVADHAMMKLVFSLLERTEDEITFEEARKIVSPSMSLDNLATYMNGMGFTIKRNLLVDEKTKKEKIEYVALLKPSNFPVKYMLRAILLAVGEKPSTPVNVTPTRSASPAPSSSPGNKPQQRQSQVATKPVSQKKSKNK